MLSILNFLSGKKTYIVSGCALVVIGLWMFGAIETDAAEKALTALGVGGMITLRAAIAKANASTPPANG